MKDNRIKPKLCQATGYRLFRAQISTMDDENSVRMLSHLRIDRLPFRCTLSSLLVLRLLCRLLSH
jgi:hypothetical protein